MVTLLVFIYGYFGGAFWSEKKNCGTQKVNLAVTFSKILLDVLLFLARVAAQGSGP